MTTSLTTPAHSKKPAPRGCSSKKRQLPSPWPPPSWPSWKTPPTGMQCGRPGPMALAERRGANCRGTLEERRRPQRVPRPSGRERTKPARLLRPLPKPILRRMTRNNAILGRPMQACPNPPKRWPGSCPAKPGCSRMNPLQNAQPSASAARRTFTSSPPPRRIWLLCSAFTPATPFPFSCRPRLNSARPGRRFPRGGGLASPIRISAASNSTRLACAAEPGPNSNTSPSSPPPRPRRPRVSRRDPRQHRRRPPDQRRRHGRRHFRWRPIGSAHGSRRRRVRAFSRQPGDRIPGLSSCTCWRLARSTFHAPPPN